jgi:hypothetical protein
MSVTSDVADLAAKFQKATAELTIPDVSRGSLRERLTSAGTPLGISFYSGTIAYVGQNSAGDYLVQFDDSANDGYASVWPQWAFELAQAALLGAKEVLVSANGLPFGSNLVQVLILS